MQSGTTRLRAAKKLRRGIACDYTGENRLDKPGAGCTCSPQRKTSGLYLQPAKKDVWAVLAAAEN
jgi:hypothetical protein